MDAETSDNGEPDGDAREKEYVGYIWIDDRPGERLSVWARSANEAGTKVVAAYGEGHVYSIRNEEDAQRPR